VLSGENEAALTSSLCTTGPKSWANSPSSAARSAGRCRWPLIPRDCLPASTMPAAHRPCHVRPTETKASDSKGFPRSAQRRDRNGRSLHPGASGVHTTRENCRVAACCLRQRPGPVALLFHPVVSGLRVSSDATDKQGTMDLICLEMEKVFKECPELRCRRAAHQWSTVCGSAPGRWGLAAQQ
jgi:hypothetical protein